MCIMYIANPSCADDVCGHVMCDDFDDVNGKSMYQDIAKRDMHSSYFRVKI